MNMLITSYCRLWLKHFNWVFSVHMFSVSLFGI